MYIVSDSYLKALKKESDDFSFSIKGFCSIKQGLKNLPFTNMEDILGFVIAYHELPEDLSELVRYINTLNNICDKPVVLFSYFKEGVSHVIEHINYNNIKLYVSTDMEAVTDIVIKREVYGSILKEIYPMYYRGKSLEEDEKNNFTHSLEYYKPIINLDTEKVLSKVSISPSYDKALASDIALKDFDNNPVLSLLRTKVIQKHFNIDRDLKSHLNNLLESVSLEKKVLYRSLYNIIERGEY